MHVFILWIGAGLTLCGVGASVPARALDRWQPVAAPSGLERAQALSVEEASGRLAVGGERGVALGPLAGPLQRVLLRGPVRDLAFGAGALWAATASGVYRIDDAGRIEAQTLAPGELARDARDLDVHGEWLAAATAAGIFVRSDREPWRRVAGLPFGEGTRVVWSGESEQSSELWALLDGDLWRRDAQGRGTRVGLPQAATGEGALDLTLSPEGRVRVLLARSLLERDLDGNWQSQAPALPPGATPLRLLSARGRHWMATDAGLLRSSSVSGPWRRAAAPAGHTPVLTLAGTARELFVATSQGLFRAVRDLPSPGAVASTDPPVQSVHRMALGYLELEPARMHALARAAGRSAWLPELSLRLDHERAWDQGRDHDQAYVSGATRFLEDRDRSRGEDLSASLLLQWNLGETIYRSESIEVSRESRLVAQLRDDVLDEINQLYFERQRVLAALASPPPETTPAALRLRARELAAGIDAWTGGRFSAELRTRGDEPLR